MAGVSVAARVARTSLTNTVNNQTKLLTLAGLNKVSVATDLIQLSVKL